jgi:aryl-alcohol dehydrogenase-like predicted oxidoreductase
MQYTKLGDHGPRVSRIAFGNWSAGGDWGSVDRDAAIAATRAALDLGITIFDTARAYGFGAAEELLGEALRPEITSARESLFIATKGGLRNEGGLPVRDSSPDALLRDLELSLRALGTDYVDLYVVTFTRHRDLARNRMIEGLHGVKRAAAELLRFDGAYLRFSGEIRVEHYKGTEIVDQFATQDAIWELMYFGHARS